MVTRIKPIKKMHETILNTFHVVHFETGEQFSRGGYVYIIEYKCSNKVYKFRVFNDTKYNDLIVQQIVDDGVDIIDVDSMKTEFTAPEVMIQFIWTNITNVILDDIERS